MNRKGFTLIEMLAVIVILATTSILVGININAMIEKNRQKERTEYRKVICDAALSILSYKKYKEGTINVDVNGVESTYAFAYNQKGQRTSLEKCLKEKDPDTDKIQCVIRIKGLVYAGILSEALENKYEKEPLRDTLAYIGEYNGTTYTNENASIVIDISPRTGMRKCDFNVGNSNRNLDFCQWNIKPSNEDYARLNEACQKTMD